MLSMAALEENSLMASSDTDNAEPSQPSHPAPDLDRDYKLRCSIASEERYLASSTSVECRIVKHPGPAGASRPPLLPYGVHQA